MTDKYTPGRWHHVGAYVEVENDHVPDICTCDPGDMGQDHLPRTYDEQQANARLISCAPDMLYLLREVIAVKGRCPPSLLADIKVVAGYAAGEGE